MHLGLAWGGVERFGWLRDGLSLVQWGFVLGLCVFLSDGLRLGLVLVGGPKSGFAGFSSPNNGPVKKRGSGVQI